MDIKNAFYQQAAKKAGSWFGRNDRITLLLMQLSAKLNRFNRADLSFKPVKEKVSVLMRLVKSYINGQYRTIPWKVIVSILAAFIYFVNPLDLIPDFAPVIGYTDDFSILLWVYSAVQTEIDKFLSWEKSMVSPS